jgi:chorismate lyase/3-hydroxybenzoate synthase
VRTQVVDDMPIVWRYLTPHAYRNLDPEMAPRPAAAVIHGDLGSGDLVSGDPGSGDAALPAWPWPQIRSALPPLDGESRVEVMLTARPARYERSGMFEILTTDDYLIVAGHLDEAPGDPMTARSERLYAGLLHLIAARGYPHFVRIWNVIQDINRVEGELERYRQFCLGRHEAYLRALSDEMAGRFPAATAVGARAGGLTVYGIAARAPGLPVENPNQVSAYRYPRQYGPRSPSFARALVKEWPASGRANLYVSGTASITGHETRHEGDLRAQVRQMMDNVETVVAEAGRKASRPFEFANPGTLMKAYVRHPEDLPVIRACVAERLGAEVEVLYLRADICREALLVEIDGVLSG